MGNYNMQYQNYYSSLARKPKGGKNFAVEKNRKGKTVNFFIKTLTRQLIGVLVLFLFVLACKVIVTPKTQYIYNYSKEAINKQYDYGELIEKAKAIKFKDIEVITGSFIEKIKNTISEESTINNNANLEKL